MTSRIKSPEREEQREAVQKPKEGQPPIEPSPQPVAQQSRIVVAIATPATRKLARELDVDIDSISGSGPGGRITDEDVRKAAQGKGSQRIAVTAPSQTPKIEQVPTSQQQPTSGREERAPLHGIRKRIAEKMSRSKRTAAHVTHIDEVDFTELIALREKLKPMAEKRDVKLTFLPFMMKATIAALKEFPYFNSSLDDEKQEIVLKHYFNIGFATDTPNGLIVPVVKDADKKSILQLAMEIERLSSRAREGKISLDDIQGGTFTITNIGTLGGMISTPIINVPEVAILGVHRIQKKPVVRENQIVIRDVAFIALSFDHRVVDGADAARFTSKLVSVLQSPGLMILDGVQFE